MLEELDLTSTNLCQTEELSICITEMEKLEVLRLGFNSIGPKQMLFL